MSNVKAKAAEAQVLDNLQLKSTKIRFLKAQGYRQCDVLRILKANGHPDMIAQHVSNEWNRKAKQPKELYPGEK